MVSIVGFRQWQGDVSGSSVLGSLVSSTSWCTRASSSHSSTIEVVQSQWFEVTAFLLPSNPSGVRNAKSSFVAVHTNSVTGACPVFCFRHVATVGLVLAT